MASEVYGIANFTVSGTQYSVTGTFSVKPAYVGKEVIMPINTTVPCFSEVPRPATITGTVLKAKAIKLKDVLSASGITVTLVNGRNGKTFTLSDASQTGDGDYDPYTGNLPVTFVGSALDEA